MKKLTGYLLQAFGAIIIFGILAIIIYHTKELSLLSDKQALIAIVVALFSYVYGISLTAQDRQDKLDQKIKLRQNLSKQLDNEFEDLSSPIIQTKDRFSRSEGEYKTDPKDPRVEILVKPNKKDLKKYLKKIDDELRAEDSMRNDNIYD